MIEKMNVVWQKKQVMLLASTFSTVCDRNITEISKSEVFKAPVKSRSHFIISSSYCCFKLYESICFPVSIPVARFCWTRTRRIEHIFRYISWLILVSQAWPTQAKSSKKLPSLVPVDLTCASLSHHLWLLTEFYFDNYHWTNIHSFSRRFSSMSLRNTSQLVVGVPAVRHSWLLAFVQEIYHLIYKITNLNFMNFKS
jgi:hypothetical protein